MRRQISSTIPFVEARHTLGKQKPTAIELRSSFTTSTSGAALGLAQYWHSSLSLKHPSHYVVDESAMYQCIPDNVIADSYEEDKKGRLLITVCSEPLSDVRQWNDESHYQVLVRTLALLQDLSNTHRIPLRYLDAFQIMHWSKRKRRRRGGVILNITGAWPSSSLVEGEIHD